MTKEDTSYELDETAPVSGLEDSGARRYFETGARRDRGDLKPRPDLISPFALMRIGEHFRKGAIKYDERNWEQGFPFSVCVSSAFRHLLKYVMGETAEDHLAAAVFNLQALIHYEEMICRGLLPPKLNDLPNYKGEPNVES